MPSSSLHLAGQRRSGCQDCSAGARRSGIAPGGDVPAARRAVASLTALPVAASRDDAGDGAAHRCPAGYVGLRLAPRPVDRSDPLSQRRRHRRRLRAGQCRGGRRRGRSRVSRAATAISWSCSTPTGRERGMRTCRSSTVSEGDDVDGGAAGRTGGGARTATGPHLHFEVRDDGSPWTHLARARLTSLPGHDRGIKACPSMPINRVGIGPPHGCRRCP